MVFENTDIKDRLVCSVQQDGHLRFSKEAVKIMGLRVGWAIQFAKDEHGIYLINKTDVDSINSFRLFEGNKCLYVRCSSLFEQLGYNYKENAIKFFLRKSNKYPKMELYKMYMQERPRGKHAK